MADDSYDRTELDNAIQAMSDQWQGVLGFDGHTALVRQLIYTLWDRSDVASSALRGAFAELESELPIEDPRFLTLLRKLAFIELDMNLAVRARHRFEDALRKLPPSS